MSLLNNITKGIRPKAPKIMIVGVEGVGKSTAGSKMPNPIFICGESGLVGPQFSETAHFTPSKWEDVLAFCDELIANETDFKTVVIDTLDWIEPLLYNYVCRKAGPAYKSIEDFGYGKGHLISQGEFRQLIARLEQLNNNGFSILFLCHSVMKSVKNPLGEDYDHYEPKTNAKIAGLVKEFCDAILFAHFQVYTRKNGNKVLASGGDERVVETQFSAAWDAKNRYELPEQMDFDMDKIMEKIRESIKNSISVGNAKKAETKIEKKETK